MDFIDYGIHVNESGTQIRVLCPQCSQNRKKSNEKCLAVNTIDGCWFCHHCGWAGGIKEKEYKVFKYDNTPKMPIDLIKYFEKRCIPEGIIEQEKIGFSFKHNKLWMKFPYFYNSVCVNVKYKTLDKDFMQESGGKKCLYRYDKIRSTKKTTLVITEGEIDALSVLYAGFEVTSIPDGAPSPDAKNFKSKFDFLKNTEKLFDKFEKIIIAGDNDEPGKALINELGRRIGYEKCFVVSYPENCKDANDVLCKHGVEKLKVVLSKAMPFPVEGLIKPSDSSYDLLNDYEYGVEKGLSTGWRFLDDFYTVRQGELTIVTGIPNSGKSNFVDALCLNLILKHEWNVGFFSPENWPTKRHTKTMLEKIINKTFDKTDFGERMTTEDIKEGLSFLDDQVRFIVPKNEMITVDTILKYARILCLQYGIQGLVIDPWNEIEHDIKHGEREDQYLSRELTKIRRFARFNGIHIWIVAHPKNLNKNKDGKYDPPTMYDISGGAHWRNKADNGLCIYRDFDFNTTKILVQKIRFREIGKIGETNLKYTFSGNYKQI